MYAKFVPAVDQHCIICNIIVHKKTLTMFFAIFVVMLDDSEEAKLKLST